MASCVHMCAWYAYYLVLLAHAEFDTRCVLQGCRGDASLHLPGRERDRDWDWEKARQRDRDRERERDRKSERRKKGLSVCLSGWLAGWLDGWMDGWMVC